MKRLLLLLRFCLAVLILYAAPPVDTRTQPLHPSFRTLKVYPEGAPLDIPVIRTGSGQVTISFDELADTERRLRWRLTHCDADWQPDGLNSAEYASGFNESRIEDYARSRATVQNYINYRFTFPAEDLRPLVSGNYLITVYDEDKPDESLVQARVMVSEDLVGVGAEVSSRTDFDFNGQHQQLGIKVAPRGAQLHNPYNDLTIKVIQNHRTDNTQTIRRPVRMEANAVVYEHLPELSWKAGNEYRRFETVSTEYAGMHIDHVKASHQGYLFELERDRPRRDRQYSYDSTQAGAYVVRSEDAFEGEDDTEADYVTVVFTLEMPQLIDGDIYLVGDLTCNLLDDNSRMAYYPEEGVYRRALNLKQGSYNYIYLAAGRDSSRPLGVTSTVEGDKYQTTNRYDILVYYRQPGDRYDRLLGSTVIRAGQ